MTKTMHQHPAADRVRRLCNARFRGGLLGRLARERVEAAAWRQRHEAMIASVPAFTAEEAVEIVLAAESV